MPDHSAQCLSILRLLKEKHNVLISGAPATGKSRLLNEVATAFTSPPTTPVHIPGQKVVIPRVPPVSGDAQGWPSAERGNRKVFRTVFHQNSKYREFISGVVPAVGARGGFDVVQGTLFRASEHARLADGAALLIIDEINRGPAVQVFGGSIVAIESDKRLAPDGTPGPATQFFELVAPDGSVQEYAIPHHVYLLAAMNQADTSVEPLDVAFLRRWTPFSLAPSVDVVAQHLTVDVTATAPDVAAEPKDVFLVAVRAWVAINGRIKLGRGAEYQLGHGVLMNFGPEAGRDVNSALAAVSIAWRVIRAHVDEVFFGDPRGVATVLNVTATKQGHLYTLEESFFGDEPKVSITGPEVVPTAQLYQLLRAVAG